jgi:putative oxidoreductase
MANHYTMTWLRIVCGAFFIPHVLGKALPPHGPLGFFKAASFPAPEIFMTLAGIAEAVIAVCLIAGFAVRYAAFAGAAVLFIATAAILKVGAQGVWLWNFGGVEYPLFWAFVCIGVGLAHPAGLRAVGGLETPVVRSA